MFFILDIIDFYNSSLHFILSSSTDFQYLQQFRRDFYRDDEEGKW